MKKLSLVSLLAQIRLTTITRTLKEKEQHYIKALQNQVQSTAPESQVPVIVLKEWSMSISLITVQRNLLTRLPYTNIVPRNHLIDIVLESRLHIGTVLRDKTISQKINMRTIITLRNRISLQSTRK